MPTVMSTSLMVNDTRGSSSRPSRRSAARDRSWLATITAMVTTPSSSVTTSPLATYPSALGRDPLEMSTNGCGNPETVTPTSTIARPRKISIPASVTMNAGIPTYATQ